MSFGYLLVLFANFSVKCLKFAKKNARFLFSAYFGGHVCYHSNGQSQSFSTSSKRLGVIAYGEFRTLFIKNVTNVAASAAVRSKAVILLLFILCLLVLPLFDWDCVTSFFVLQCFVSHVRIQRGGGQGARTPPEKLQKC